MIKRLVFALLTFLLFLPLSFLPAYSEIKLNVFAILAGLLIWNEPLTIQRRDIPFLMFLMGCLISLIDIRSISNSWQYLSIWFTGFAFVFWGRPFFNKHKPTIIQILKIVFWTTVLYVLFWIFFHEFAGWGKGKLINEIIPWKVFGKNINMATIFPMLLLPLFIFQPVVQKKDLFIRGIAIAIMAYFIYFFNSQMGMLLSVFYVMGYLAYQMSLRNFLFILAGILLLLGMFFNFWIPRLIHFLEIGSFDVRLPHDISAYRMMKDNPFNGLGLGSYFYEIHTYSDGKEVFLKDHIQNGWTFNTSMARNHNNLSKLLADIGPIFWTLFIIPVFIEFFSSMKNPEKRNHFVFWVIFAGFYICSLTLRQSFSDYIELSEVHLLFFISYILMTVEGRPSFSLVQKILKPIGLVIMAMTFAYFSYNFLTNHYQLKAVAEAKAKNYEKAIELLEPWYHPVFMTTINEAEPIARHLARWYYCSGNPEKSKFYYKEALSVNPDDPGLKYEAKNIFKKSCVDYFRTENKKTKKKNKNEVDSKSRKEKKKKESK
jgi:hypothetical protein